MRCLSLRLRARLPILRRALSQRYGSLTVSTIRRSILVAFVGASCWVFAPLVVAGSFTSNPHAVAILLLRIGELASAAAWDALVVRSVQNEIAVVTLAAVAWVLAGMVKSKV
jgi:hypothetical protein